MYLLERINAMVREQGKAVGDSIVNVDMLLNNNLVIPENKWFPK